MKQPFVSHCCGGKVEAIIGVGGHLRCKLCNQDCRGIPPEEWKRVKLEKRYKEKIKKLKSKVPLRLLKKQLWAITSKIVRSKSAKCFTCDKPLPKFSDRQAAHFWTNGGHPATRYDFRNLRVCCVGCNTFKSGNLAEYSVRLLQELGEPEFNRLASLARTEKKWSREELEKLIAERTEILKKLSHE